MYAHVPPESSTAATFSHLQPPSTSTSPPTLPLLPPSTINPSFPLVSPAFPLKFRRRIQSASSKPTSVAQDPRRLKLQTLAALDNCQDRVSLSDVRHLAARGASGSSSVGGDEFYFGVKFILFSMSSCFRFGLRPLFASVAYPVPLVSLAV